MGEWLPGRYRIRRVVSGPRGDAADPADRVTLDESVSMAFLVALESMTPAERVALILHDVFGYPFAEVAEINWPHPRGLPPAGLHSPPPRRRRPPTRGPDDPAGQHRQGLQSRPGKPRTSAPSSACSTPAPS